MNYITTPGKSLGLFFALVAFTGTLFGSSGPSGSQANATNGASSFVVSNNTGDTIYCQIQRNDGLFMFANDIGAGQTDTSRQITGSNLAVQFNYDIAKKENSGSTSYFYGKKGSTMKFVVKSSMPNPIFTFTFDGTSSGSTTFSPTKYNDAFSGKYYTTTYTVSWQDYNNGSVTTPALQTCTTDKKGKTTCKVTRAALTYQLTGFIITITSSKYYFDTDANGHSVHQQKEEDKKNTTYSFEGF